MLFFPLYPIYHLKHLTHSTKKPYKPWIQRKSLHVLIHYWFRHQWAVLFFPHGCWSWKYSFNINVSAVQVVPLWGSGLGSAGTSPHLLHTHTHTHVHTHIHAHFVSRAKSPHAWQSLLGVSHILKCMSILHKGTKDRISHSVQTYMCWELKRFRLLPNHHFLLLCQMPQPVSLWD